MVARHRGHVLRRAVAFGLLAAGWAAIVGNGWWHHDGSGPVGRALADLPAAAGFAAIVAACPPGLLASAPMRPLGTLAYGVYLWHMPVLEASRLHGAFPDTALAALPAVLAPTLALAAASWFRVERPALRRVAARRPRRHEREVRRRTRLGGPAVEPAD